MNPNQNLILLRGLPGAGKSSFAELISENNSYPIFSVDDYFTDQNGIYTFEFSKNHLAYSACLNHTEQALRQGILKVIVHNTFTMEWEMQPYFKLAEKYLCRLYVMTVENYHGKHNLHEVNEEQIKKMAEKYHVKLF
jgi:predicted kinase